MKPLEKAMEALYSMSLSKDSSSIDTRFRLLVTLVFIIMVLSVPMLQPEWLIWMFVFPILTSEFFGIGYGKVLLKSLYVLPLVCLIGIFNPIIDRQTFWIIGGVSISAGWVSFISIILRGLLSVQAVLVLVMSIGFYDVIKSLRGLGCPAVLTTQLMMVYRYVGVLVQEALTMHRARVSRGFGKKSYPLKMWGTFVGQLLVRSVHRARRIDAAMMSRGFKGTFHSRSSFPRPSVASWIWLIVWTGAFLALRFLDFTSIVNNLVS